MKTRLRAGRRIVLACLLGATLLPLAAQAETAAPADPVTAVWKMQRIDFVYGGYNTFYTCGGLRDKLIVILRNLGARDGVKLTHYECENGTSRARFQITLESPVEATPENLRALTDYDSQDRLIALARSEPLPIAEDLPRFPAEWKTVSFSRDRKMKLAASDCELVEQLRRQILPRLSVQVLQDNLFCSRAFTNIGRPRLKVSALVAQDAR